MRSNLSRKTRNRRPRRQCLPSRATHYSHPLLRVLCIGSLEKPGRQSPPDLGPPSAGSVAMSAAIRPAGGALLHFKVLPQPERGPLTPAEGTTIGSRGRNRLRDALVKLKAGGCCEPPTVS